MIEEWKPVVGFETYYQVSNKGNVKSLYRVVKYEDGRIYNKKEKLFKSTLNAYGYSVVVLRIENTIKRCRVHRLVAEAFIPNPNNLPEVNHINGIKHDNSVENLEWCDSSYNKKHAYDNNLRDKKISLEQREEIINLRKTTNFTYYKIAEMYNVSYQLIHWICSNNLKSQTILY